MAEQKPEPIEISAEDLPEEPPAAEAWTGSERLVIEAEDLPTEEEVSAEGRAFPGFEGGTPPVGLYVVGHCASGKGEYVLSLAPRAEGGYWIEVAPGKSAAGIGKTIAAQGPFGYRKGFACPQCHAPNVVVCECGALFCHGGKPMVTCPVCQKRLRVAGPATQVEAYGGGKGGG